MSHDIIKHIAEHTFDVALLDPAVKVAAGAARDQIAEILGPQWSENLFNLGRRFSEKTKGKKTEAPPLSVSLPLLEAARDESREILQDLWASLLAAASDPAKRGFYRREFVDIARQMEPIDALVLPLLNTNSNLGPSRREYVASKLGESTDNVQLAFENLERLRLVDSGGYAVPQGHPFVKTLGRQFLRAVEP